MKIMSHQIPTSVRRLTLSICLSVLAAICGCHSTPEKKKSDFFTSGSREADQRASQRMAKEEQLQGSGEGAGEKNVKKAEKKSDDSGNGSTTKAAQAEEKLTLYDRLGGEK